MAHAAHPKDVYFEIGTKRVFAGAIMWPGWCRNGRDGGAALEALAAYGPRYARVLATQQIPFDIPDVSELRVVERLAGGTSTDFGAPEVMPSSDTEPVDADELARLVGILEACWAAFDAAVASAHGKELRKGPRGGGRDCAALVGHTLGAEAGYLSRLARPFKIDEAAPNEEATRLRQAVRDALDAAARGNLPEKGPRGGTIWTPRYFVRRCAWHVLDHTWEIEDRIV